MNEYPEIPVGGGVADTSVRQWRALTDQVKTLNRAVFGDNNTQVTASGVRSTARILAPLLREPDRTVVIVRRPVDGDKRLLVREAKYKTLPPQPCTGDGDSAVCDYEWYGESFEAAPPMGMKAIAFAGDENTTPTTTPPKLTTKFHRCHREHDAWVLNAPGGTTSTTSIVLVHGPGVGTNWNAEFDFIRVIHMKKNPAYVLGNGQPTHISAEGAAGYSLVQCWPGTKQADWQWFLSTNQGFPPVPLATAVYLTTKMIGGVEYICPEVFAEAGAPDSGTIAGDC